MADISAATVIVPESARAPRARALRRIGGGRRNGRGRCRRRGGGGAYNRSGNGSPGLIPAGGAGNPVFDNNGGNGGAVGGMGGQGGFGTFYSSDNGSDGQSAS